MLNGTLVIRVLAGIWVVHLLIILLKVWAAISGNYAVNWSQEFALYGLIVPTSAAAVAVALRWGASGRAASGGTANGAERAGD